MRIIYPHNQKFMLRRAHDALVMKTCHALASRGHEVHLLMGRTGGSEPEILRYYGLSPLETLHLVQLPILRSQGLLKLSWHAVFNFFCWRALRSITSERAVDVIYLTEIKLARFLLRKKPRLGVPFVYEIHGLLAPGYERPDPVETEVFSNCEALITTTRSLQDVIERLYSPSAPIHRVPLASDLPEAVCGFDPPAPGGVWKLGYIGQLYRLQGVELLLRALPLLPERARLEVIGGKEEHIRDLSSIAKSLDIEHRVSFHGFLPPGEVFSKAAGFHILVAPSLAEKKMPFVAHTKIYEYLAMGKPVVAADLPSICEEIRDGVNGILFEAGNAASLADSVLKLLNDPALAVRIAAAGARDVRELSWDHRAGDLERCFASLSGAGRCE